MARIKENKNEYVTGKIVIEIPNETMGMDDAIGLPDDPIAWVNAMKASAYEDDIEPTVTGDISAVLEMLGDGGGITILTFCPTAEKDKDFVQETSNNFSLALSKSCAMKLGRALVMMSELNFQVKG